MVKGDHARKKAMRIAIGLSGNKTHVVLYYKQGRREGGREGLAGHHPAGWGPLNFQNFYEQ